MMSCPRCKAAICGSKLSTTMKQATKYDDEIPDEVHEELAGIYDRADRDASLLILQALSSP